MTHIVMATCGREPGLMDIGVGCGGRIEQWQDVYRCWECRRPYHRACLGQHCAADLASVRRAADASAGASAALRVRAERAERWRNRWKRAAKRNRTQHRQMLRLWLTAVADRVLRSDAAPPATPAPASEGGQP
jgi:hypothetical protein